MMIVSLTELRKNIGKYMKMVKDHDVCVSKYGKVFAVIKSVSSDPVEGLSGLLKGYGPVDEDELREQRIKERYAEYFDKKN